jgi:hypothetical protein
MKEFTELCCNFFYADIHLLILFMKAFLISILLLLIIVAQGHSQMIDAPDRTEGDGPFERLIIRGVTMIDGTGSPAVGPVDIVIEGNKISQIVNVGYPGVPIREKRRPESGPDDYELDAEGLYLLPGFFDMHAHTGGIAQGTSPEYVYKLWLAHGITSIREPGSFNGADWTLRHTRRSEANEITAPRIYPYIGFGMDNDESIQTPVEARRWVQQISERGFKGIKFFGARPDIFRAALDEANSLGLGSVTHHAQTRVVYANVAQTAEWGLKGMTHWYGLPEALFTDQIIQDYPLDYNYNNEQHRFEAAGTLWKQAAEPGSNRWNEVMDQLLAVNFEINPTFTIYEASRDLMRARRAEWHELYTLPSLWEFYKPSREAHGSYWFNWGTEQEIAWKENYRLWMQFINEYKNRGGRVTLGSDAGYIYKLYGFAYIREMELFREAGFHPLEIFQSASLKAAEVLGVDDQLGTIEVGKLADLILVDENPQENLKVLYGTGAIRVNDQNEVVRAGGIMYTIKDGIIYDAKKLLQDVKNIVDEKKNEELYDIIQPGFEN